MKILYLLLLALSINCLRPTLPNSLQFQKQKAKLVKQIKEKIINPPAFTYNKTLIKKFDFSGDAVLDFLPAADFEQELNKLNLPNDAKKLIISSTSQSNTKVESNYNYNSTLNFVKSNVSLVISTKFNTTKGSFIGFAYLKGKTTTHLKVLYKRRNWWPWVKPIIKPNTVVRCGNKFPLVKCIPHPLPRPHPLPLSVKRNLTNIELEEVKKAAKDYTYWELIRLMLDKWVN